MYHPHPYKLVTSSNDGGMRAIDTGFCFSLRMHKFNPSPQLITEQSRSLVTATSLSSNIPRKAKLKGGQNENCLTIPVLRTININSGLRKEQLSYRTVIINAGGMSSCAWLSRHRCCNLVKRYTDINGGIC